MALDSLSNSNLDISSPIFESAKLEGVDPRLAKLEESDPEAYYALMELSSANLLSFKVINAILEGDINLLNNPDLLQ